MPYPNEHAARMTDPSKYKEFRRYHPKGFPKGVDVILGITEDGKSEIQAVRAKRSAMTFSEFKTFLKERDMNPIKTEEATMQKSVELFSTWTEIDISKSRDDQEEQPKAYVAGIISSDAQDLQGDRILQEGMQWDYFLRRGWLNYEHQQGPENILGVPTAVKAVTLEGGKKATRVEGYLLMDRPKAREIAETAKALKSMQSDRTIGYSVEGQVLQRDPKNPKIITKSRILNVSITAHPVNPDTTLELLARSLLDVGAGAVENQIDTNLTEGQDMEITEKGQVGYMQPAQPSEDDSLSELAESSMSEDVASEDMASMFQDALKRVMQDAMAELMREQMGKMMDPQVKEPVMVSLAQMNTLMAKVFPSLPQSEQKSIARKLLSAAKGSYNKH